MPFTEDLGAFLSTSDFATPATFSRTSLTKNVIFDKEYSDPLGVEASGPRALGAVADFPGIVHGDTLTIAGTVYAVIGVQPDGTGMATFILRES